MEIDIKPWEKKSWGCYGFRCPHLEERYPVVYKPSDVEQLNNYIDILLTDTKEGMDWESAFMKEWKHKVLPLVFHPIEFANLHEEALRADKDYERRHTPPYTCFGDSMCTIDQDTLWGALYSRLEEKITSMRHERAIALEESVRLGTIQKEEVWFEYAFYTSNDVDYFKREALEMRRMKDRKRGDQHIDKNAWTSHGQYNTYQYEKEDHTLLQRAFPWGMGI